MKKFSDIWDKECFVKALSLVVMSWLALPILYYMFVKAKRNKKEMKNVAGAGKVESVQTTLGGSKNEKKE